MHSLHSSKRRRRAIACLAAGAISAGLTAMPAAGAGFTTVLTIPLGGVGKGQLCYRSGPTHIGKCNAAPLIHSGELTIRGENLAAAPQVSTTGTRRCAEEGPEIVIRPAPGGSVSATLSGVKPLTGGREEVTIATIPLDQTVAIYACVAGEG